eukprot:3330011-Pyramimonas_sp.AAC.1
MVMPAFEYWACEFESWLGVDSVSIDAAGAVRAWPGSRFPSSARQPVSLSIAELRRAVWAALQLCFVALGSQ